MTLKGIRTKEFNLDEYMPLTHTYSNNLFNIEIVFDNTVRMTHTDKCYLNFDGVIKIRDDKHNIVFEGEINVLNTRIDTSFYHTVTVFSPLTAWTMSFLDNHRTVSSTYVMSYVQSLIGYRYVHHADDAINAIILTMLDPHKSTICDMMTDMSGMETEFGVEAVLL